MAQLIAQDAVETGAQGQNPGLLVAQDAVEIGATGNLFDAWVAQVAVEIAVQFPVLNTNPTPTWGKRALPSQQANEWDQCLWEYGLKAKAVDWPVLPELRDMPLGAQEFRLSQTIVTPATALGDVAVINVVQPHTYNAVIHGICCYYTGTGFVEGGGDLVWRLRVGRGWARDFNAIKTQLGLPNLPLELTDYIPILAGQRILFTVSVPNLSGLIQIGSSNIVCTLSGWVYPTNWTRAEEKTRGRA